MLNYLIGYYEFKISKLDKLGDYIDRDTIFINPNEKNPGKLISSCLMNAINKSARNKLVRKKYKNKTAILEASNQYPSLISLTAKITKIVNEDAFKYTHKELVDLSDQVSFYKNMTIDEYCKLTTATIETYYDLYGNSISRYECDIDHNHDMRRELYDYNTIWNIYSVGDIVKLKRPKYGCYEATIINNAKTLGLMKSNKYTFGWGNFYEAKTMNGYTIFPDELHYVDIEGII